MLARANATTSTTTVQDLVTDERKHNEATVVAGVDAGATLTVAPRTVLVAAAPR